MRVLARATPAGCPAALERLPHSALFLLGTYSLGADGAKAGSVSLARCRPRRPGAASLSLGAPTPSGAVFDAKWAPGARGGAAARAPRAASAAAAGAVTIWELSGAARDDEGDDDEGRVGEGVEEGGGAGGDEEDGDAHLVVVADVVIPGAAAGAPPPSAVSVDWRAGGDADGGVDGGVPLAVGLSDGRVWVGDARDGRDGRGAAWAAHALRDGAPAEVFRVWVAASRWFNRGWESLTHPMKERARRWRLAA